jgi:hypothetical protein
MSDWSEKQLILSAIDKAGGSHRVPAFIGQSIQHWTKVTFAR